MVNGNTAVSETVQRAVARIQALRAVTQKTGIQTYEEQNRILLALENTDMLAVADAVGSRPAQDSFTVNSDRVSQATHTDVRQIPHEK